MLTDVDAARQWREAQNERAESNVSKDSAPHVLPSSLLYSKLLSA
jgi:hypothetical protein